MYSSCCGHGLLGRYIVLSLPLLLLGGVATALVGTRALQLVQSRVFHVVPFGLLSKFSILDACVGILVSGSFMLYFGASLTLCCIVLKLCTVLWDSRIPMPRRPGPVSVAGCSLSIVKLKASSVVDICGLLRLSRWSLLVTTSSISRALRPGVLSTMYIVLQLTLLQCR